MTEWIRVRDTSGHEISVRADVPEGHPRGIQPGMTPLEKDALGNDGLPRAPKYRLPLGEPLPGGTVAQRRERTRKPVPTTEPAAGENGHPADPDKEN